MGKFSELRNQFAKFAVAGAIGFVVDAGTLNILVEHYGLNPYRARFASFLLAATTTWWINRMLTFRSDRRATVHEWGRYAMSMTLGAFVNIGVYSGVLWTAGSARQPVLLAALATGTLSGMSFNFYSARRILHREPASVS